MENTITQTEKSEKIKPLKSSWGGRRVGAGRKKNIPNVSMEYPYEEVELPELEVVEILEPYVTDEPLPEGKMKKRRASQNRPLTALDRLWNKAADGDIKAIKKYLDMAYGKVR